MRKEVLGWPEHKTSFIFKEVDPRYDLFFHGLRRAEGEAANEVFLYNEGYYDSWNEHYDGKESVSTKASLQSWARLIQREYEVVP